MALMLISFDVDNYDEWKELFDSDPGGRKSVAKGHRISRSVDNPNEIFLSVEYASADEARTVLARLKEAGSKGSNRGSAQRSRRSPRKRRTDTSPLPLRSRRSTPDDCPI